MTITPEQVRDLRPGDVVRLSDEDEGWTVEGALWNAGGSLRCGTTLVRYPDGQPPQVQSRVMGVVSRAPRLYVNHDRAEPAPGDVVTAAEYVEIIPDWRPTWVWTADKQWIGTHTGRQICNSMVSPLRLLVDGTTGQVVEP